MSLKSAAFCFVLITAFVISANAQIGRTGSNRITYHIYGNGQIYGACDYYSQVSAYGGYITANSLGLECFSCVRMSHNGKSIHVTVVDTGGEGFDLNEPAFIELCGSEGINAGRCSITWEIVEHSKCPGNPKAGSTPKPSTPGGGGSSVRCGSSWTAANDRCGGSCVNDGQCSNGEKCWADLSMSPCGGSFAVGEFGDQVHVADDSPFLGEEGFSDFAGADDASQQQQFSDGKPAAGSDSIPSWAVALIVLGCLLLLGLFAIMVQLIALIRRSG